MITACKSPKCINNVDTEWTYCPHCGTKQTSEVRKEKGITTTLPFSGNEIPSAPKGEESGDLRAGPRSDGELHDCGWRVIEVEVKAVEK